MKKRLKIFLISVILISYFLILIFSQKKIENFFYAYISEPFLNIPELKIEKKEPEIEIEAKAALIFRIGKRERILFKKKINEILPIASLTKLMTALISFENYDLSDFVKVSKKAADQEDVPNYGNLKEGEVFRVKTLLDLMLIYSSNDAAFALAEKIGLENFVEKMNQKAKEIGMEKTIFSEPTGLAENYSTAKDLIKLTKFILKERPEIFEITLKKGPYPVKDGILDISLPESKKLIGGKTGYTEEAGGCMVFVFEDENGKLFLNVILGANSVKDRVEEMQKLVDWINQ